MYKKRMSHKMKTVIVWMLVAALQLTNILPMATVYADDGGSQIESSEKDGETTPPAIGVECEKIEDDTIKTIPMAFNLNSSPRELDGSEINMINPEFILGDGSDAVTVEGENYFLELGIKDLSKVFNMSFKMSFGFSLNPGHTINPGDYYEFEIPESFTFKNVIDEPIGSPDVFASYSITNGTVRITFNNEIKDGQPVIDGKFQVVGALGQTIKDGGLSQEYLFDINGSKTFNIVITNNKGEMVRKGGAHTKNEPTVKWTVDINKKMQDIANKELSDTKQEEIVDGSIKVYELTPKLIDGSIVFEQAGTPTTNGFDLNNNTFPMTFKAIENASNNKAYRIEYGTTVTEDEREAAFNGISKVTNCVTLSNTTDGTSLDTVTLKFDKPIIKSAGDYNPQTGEIEWTVVVNADNRDISQGIKIVDTITHEGAQSADNTLMDFVKDGSGNVIVEIDPGEKAGSKDIILNNKTLTIQFKPQDGNENVKHTIKYMTKDEIVDKAYTVKNGAEISYGPEFNKGYESNEGSKYVSTNMISKGGQTGSKINYKDNTIDWHLTFNANLYNGITNVTITDIFESGKYLKMYKANFVEENKAKLHPDSGGTNSNGFKLELAEAKDDQDGKGQYTLRGFNLKAPGSISEKITFNYTTVFDPTEEYADNSVKNTVKVDWTKNSTPYTNSATYTAKFNDFTKIMAINRAFIIQ